MTREEIFDELRGAMVDLFDTDEGAITLTATLAEDLDLDSIDAIDLIVRMQELTGQKIDQDELKQVRSVGDVVDVVARLIKTA